MAIYKRGKKYGVDLRDPTGKRKRFLTGTSKMAAKEVERKVQAKYIHLKHTGEVVPTEESFNSYAASWLKSKKKRNRYSTVVNYSSIVQSYGIPFFGDRPMSCITPRLAQDFADSLDDLLKKAKERDSIEGRKGGRRKGVEKLLGKTKNNILSVISSIFADAVRLFELPANPFDSVPWFEEEEPEVDPLSYGEMKAVLTSVDPYYHAYFSMAFLTGMRPCELIGLRPQDVDLQGRQIFVRRSRARGRDSKPKTKASKRDIRISDELLPVLRHHAKTIPRRSRYFFVNLHGGPLDAGYLLKMAWYPALKKAGVRKRIAYQTRHTFASLCLMQGEDPQWVRRTLGHTDLQMLYKLYSKYVLDRSWSDGERFAKGLTENGVLISLHTVFVIPPLEARRPYRKPRGGHHKMPLAPAS